MGVSEFLTTAAEIDSGSCENFNSNRTNNVKVEKSQEDKDSVIEHEVQGSLDDREEGEIVDDYEFIISSDEEFCMRQRIEELEATNAELEKIAKISGNTDEYNYVARKDSQLFTAERFPLASIDLINGMDCQRAAQVPTDASSISSVEFPTPKKRKRRKSKACRGTAHAHKQQTSKQEQKHRTETHRSDHKKHKHTSKHVNMVLLHSGKDLVEAQSHSHESSDMDGDDNYTSGCYLSREELRFAVARFSNSEISPANLKARLEKEKNRNSGIEIPVKYNSDSKSDHSIQPIVVDDDDSSDSESLEEQELRLIALKSAVMKKHLARKKRDAEVAYSPTDFEDVLANSYSIRDDEMDVVEVEMDELEHNSRNSMEISPVASPKLHLSPEEEENSRMSMATEINEMNEVENTKLVDMDIANSDSDDELQPYENDKERWLPLDQIPLPTLRDSRTTLCQNAIQMAYDGILFPPSCSPIQYSNFPLKHQLEPPPLPPGVAYFEEQPPPPPPFILDYPSTKLKDFHVGDEKQNDQSPYQPNSRKIYAHNKVKIEHPCTSVECSNERVKFEKGDDDDDDEEEEEALRALLLSKFNPPKVCKSKNLQINLSSKDDSFKHGNDSEETNCTLLTSIEKRKTAKNPTESILKEAVRRLKLKTVSVQSVCMEEDLNNSRSSVGRNSQTFSPVELQTSAIGSNEISQSTVPTGNDKALILNEDKIENLPFAFKEMQCKSNPSNFCLIEQRNTDPNLVIKKTFVTVRSVEKINETYNLSSKKVDTETASENSLHTEEVSTSGMEVLHFKVKVTNKDQITRHETYENKPNESPINAKKDINTFETEKQADQNDNNLNKVLNEIRFIENTHEGEKTAEVASKPVTDKLPKLEIEKQANQNKNNLNKVSHEPCDIENIDIDEKLAEVAPKPVIDEIPKTKSCDSLIDKSTISTLNTERNILSGVTESLSSSAVSQAVLSKKIVKPNKVINTQTEIKRKSQDLVKVPAKLLKITSKPDSPQITSSNYSSLTSSRLITSADISTVQVKKLIISLRASDTETSDEESLSLTKSLTTNSNQPRFETMDPLVCTINNDYYDNASPISLPMDSPGITPNRANSPSGDFLVTDLSLTKSFVNDCFKEKLDTFLKNVRTQVQQAVTQPIKPIENENLKSNTSNMKQCSTPVAMKHLPQASQQEYRRLVHRMQLLEKQKQAKSNEKATTVTNTTIKECDDSKAHTNNEATKRLLLQKAKLDSTQTVPSQESPKASNGNTLFKKVLLKNASSTTTTTKSNSLKSVKKSIAQQQPSKLNVLRAYENSFLKTGTGIITNLDKSLQLVEEAKQAKMSKLQHEKRLQELRIEMDEIQHKFRQEQQKISRIYPEICESNEVITTLKQRRSKLLKAATNLGKFIKGDEYRLNNDLKQQITMKSKILATQIKLVNSMKYSDIVKVNEMLNQNQHLDKAQISEYTIKSNEKVPSSSQTILDKFEQKKILLKDSLKLPNNTTEHIPNEELYKARDSDMSDCNNAEATSPNEEIETQERTSKELPEKNDVISKKSVEFVENISEKEDSLTCIEEHKMSLVPEYISPLLPLKTSKRYLDPNGIICPYDLMGKCEDKDCNYIHISVKSMDET